MGFKKNSWIFLCALNQLGIAGGVKRSIGTNYNLPCWFFLFKFSLIYVPIC